MAISLQSLDEGYTYLQQHPEVRDILLSGGDPLLLDNTQIEQIL